MLIRFLPNLVLQCALISPVHVQNFSLIGTHICILWQILQSVRNEEERKNKTKKLDQNFSHLYLRTVWSNFLKIWYVDFPTWPALLQ